MICLSYLNEKVTTMMKTDTGPACDLQYVKETGRMIEVEEETL